MEFNVIKKIADKYGKDFLLEGKRLSGLIADFVPNDKKTRNLLNTAIRDKIPQKLYDMKPMSEADREMRVKGLCIRFMEDNSLTEAAAYKTVKCFADVFGYFGDLKNSITEKKSSDSTLNHNVSVPDDDEVMQDDPDISDLGLVTKKGDWIYYQNEDDNCTLYKMHADGKRKTKLNDDWSYSINVSGAWIYYCNRSDGEKLYKVRTDGKERTKLNNDKSLFIAVSGNWIYYSNWSDGEKLYKIRTDGNSKTKLNDDECQNISVTGNWVYYTNWSDGKKRYKINTSGTHRQTSD